MVKVRRILDFKTGYIGTLDPFATGVLPIAVGEARKYIRFIEKSEKKYTFTAVFGKSTDTLDKSGKIIDATERIPSKMEITKILPEFLGEIEQIPPLFSAIKINGRRSCDLVRQGKSVTLRSKKVKILDLKMIDGGEWTFEVVCSSGTYIRSLVRDIAEKLGSLAYVKELRRTRSGFFSIKDAISLAKLQKMKDTSELVDVLISVESPLDDIPALYLGKEDVTRLKNGLLIFVENSTIVDSNVRIVDGDCGKFCGIGFVSSSWQVKPVRMCASD
jgi:tRNA pseudouridine55 synthase